MVNEISPVVYESALAAGIKLKALLEGRLNGLAGASYGTIVGVQMPTENQPSFAKWFGWRCRLQGDNVANTWLEELSIYIPAVELYAIFRNAFAGIAMAVEHPVARLYVANAADGAELPLMGRVFTGSGHEVVVSGDNPAFVRPVGDLAGLCWVNAELRADSGLSELYGTDDLRFACNVDALEFGQRRGAGRGIYDEITSLSQRPTYYVTISAGLSLPQVIYLPIARLVNFDRSSGQATFELDQSVVECD